MATHSDAAVQVRVLKIGTCTVDPGNMTSREEVALKHRLGVGGGSTVTLVRGPEGVLLVDTEPPDDPARPRGLRPEDVTHVFITHFHRDHFGCRERFPGAAWHCYDRALPSAPLSLRGRFVPVGEGDVLVGRAAVSPTPGHTEGHASLLVAAGADEPRVAVCGDAVLDLAGDTEGSLPYCLFRGHVPALLPFQGERTRRVGRRDVGRFDGFLFTIHLQAVPWRALLVRTNTRRRGRRPIRPARHA